MSQPRTLGELKRSGARPSRRRQGRDAPKPAAQAERRREAVSGDPGLRRVGRPADRERGPLAPQHDPARAAGPGQEPPAAEPDDAARPAPRHLAGCEIHDDPFRPSARRCRDLIDERRGRRTHRVADAGGALRREAGDPRRHHRRRHRRRGPDPGRQGRPRPRQRAHHPLRPAAPGPPRDLRAQRAARPRGRIQVGSLQHPPGGRRPDQGLPRAPSPGRVHGLHRQPRGLHGAGKDHHAPQGPHRQRDPHPLSRRPWSTARPSPSRRPGPTRASTSRIPRFVREVVEGIAFAARSDKKIDQRSGVSQRLPISALENAVSNAERRALLASETPVVPRISPTSMRRSRPSPASSSSSTRAS